MSGISILGALILAAALGRQATAQAGDVAVMSFNIRYGTADDGENAWPLRQDLVLETIRMQHPDVLSLQEALAFQIDQLETAFPGYRRVGVGRDDGERAGEYAAIMFRIGRFELLDSGSFWFSDTPAVPGSMSWGNRITRLCTWVRLRDTTSGQAFYIYNVHWDHESQASRERSAGLLLDRIATRDDPDPVIVTGDFNAGEANPAFVALTANGLRDTFRALHPDADSAGTFNAFEGIRTGEKIDAVLVSDGWAVLDASIVRTNRDGRYPSDHFPVTAVLQALPGER